MYNWEIFQTAYQNASLEVKAMIDAETIPSCVHEVIATKQLDASHYSKLVRIYALLYMNTITEQTAEQEMMRIGIPQSKEVLNSLFICTGKTNTSETQKAVPATPITPSSIPPFRTMAADMVRSQTPEEKVYSSTQEALLRESQTTSEQKPPEQGSWG